MSADYRVTVTIGAQSWEIDSTAPVDGYGLAEPLTIARSVPDSDLWPVQPNPAQASIAVVTARADALEDLAIGDPVAVRVYMPAAAVTPVESFHGRVAEASYAPHKLGVIWTIVCLDYLADLMEDRPWTGARVSGSFSEADANIFFDGFGIPEPPRTPTIVTTRRCISPEKGSTLAPWDYIGQLLVTNPQIWSGRAGRYVIRPRITADALDPTTPYELVAMYRDLPPGHDSYDDPPDPTDPAVIDAAHVERDGTGTLRKYDAVQRVVINYTQQLMPSGDLEARTEDAALLGWTVSTSVDTVLLFITGDGIVAETLAADLLLPSVPRSRWTTDTFRWLLHNETPGTYVPALGDYFAVNGVDDRWHPNGYTWIVGRLTSYTLTIDGTRPVVDFTLRDPGT